MVGGEGEPQRGRGGVSQLADLSLHHDVAAAKVANLAAVERLTLLHTCESRGRRVGVRAGVGKLGPGDHIRSLTYTRAI